MPTAPRWIVLLVILAVSTIVNSNNATAQNYVLESSNLVAAGGEMTGGAFNVISSIGQIETVQSMGGSYSLAGGFLPGDDSNDVLLGDVNLDGVIDLLDVSPFVDRISSGEYQAEADVNEDGAVNLLDVSRFVDILTG